MTSLFYVADNVISIIPWSLGDWLLAKLSEVVFCDQFVGLRLAVGPVLPIVFIVLFAVVRGTLQFVITLLTYPVMPVIQFYGFQCLWVLEQVC